MNPQPPTNASAWRALRRDPVPYAVLAVFALFSLPYFFPLLAAGTMASYTRTIFPALSNAVALGVLVWGIGRLAEPSERRFWRLLAGALVSLILANGGLELSYAHADNLAWGVATDLLYLVFYVFLGLAAQAAPHRAVSSLQRFSWQEIAALGIAATCLLTYFVVLPLAYDLGDYRTWLPSMYLYLALDASLVLLFVRLALDAGTTRWRVIYTCVTVGVASWLLMDLQESLQYAGLIPLIKGGFSDLAWNIPLLALVVAARVRHAGFDADAPPPEADVDLVKPLTSIALLATIALPVIHLGFEALGLVNLRLREPRQVLVWWGVVLLGLLAFLERREVQRRRWTDRRQRQAAELALRESEARYRDLVENAPDAIVVFDAETGKFVDSNDRALALYGVSREELLDSGPVDFSPPVQPDGRASAEMAEEKIARALAGEIVNFEWTHRNISGRERLCDVCLTRQPAAGRRLVRGSVVDITEQVVLRERLRESQRMESIGRLAGGVAHDFNNLLTVITGYSDLVLGSRKLPAALRDDLEQIRTAGERAASLTGQLLAFSRRQVMQLQPIDLNEVVRGMQGMLRRLIGEDLTLVVTLDPRLGRIAADPGQVEQVILNLAANARDAMPAGGVLGLETSCVSSDDDLAVGAVPRKVYGRLAVTDTGVGMDAETRSKIFEPFFTTKSLGRGTGLGLATVYGIVMQGGGYVTVESAPGHGSRFEVHFPTADDAATGDDAEHDVTVSPLGDETVLVIEDETAVRELARSGLEALGYRVVVAPDGEEGWRLAQRLGGEIDVVVSDVVLPGISGPDVVERIRELIPGVRVLLMSGYTDDLIARKGALEAGTPFLQKPFTAGRLAERIRQVVDRSVPPSPVRWAEDGDPAN
jgi:PAS domain S-box-containing protein